MKVEPLHQPDLPRISGVGFERRLGAAVLADQAEIEMAVIRRAFRLAVARLRAPAHRQIEQRIPEDAWREAGQKLDSALQAELLHLFGAKRAYADFCHPHRLVGDSFDL